MFGRKRKKDDESTGLAGLSDASLTPTVTVSTAPPSAGTPATPATPAAPGTPAPAPPAGLTSFSTTTVSGPAALAQILGSQGPVADLIAQIKADPQGFRDRMLAQAQAAGVSTFVMTPQGMSPAGGSAATPPQHVDVVEELTKAADLHDKGALTDEEFEALKKKLLGQ